MAPAPVSESDDPDVIQRQIDHTRDQLAVTVNAIAERLSPDNLIEQAKSSAKEATSQIVATTKSSSTTPSPGRIKSIPACGSIYS